MQIEDGVFEITQKAVSNNRFNNISIEVFKCCSLNHCCPGIIKPFTQIIYSVKSTRTTPNVREGPMDVSLNSTESGFYYMNKCRLNSVAQSIQEISLYAVYILVLFIASDPDPYIFSHLYFM